MDKLQIEFWKNNSGQDREYKTASAITNVTSWNHYIITWDNTNIQTTPTVYINGVAQAVSSTQGAGTGNAGTINGTIALMGNDGVDTSTELQGSLSHFAFFNKSLSASERAEVMSAADLTLISCASNIIDYWKLGDELISNNVGDTLSSKAA